MKHLEKHVRHIFTTKPDRTFFVILCIAIIISGFLYAGKQLLLRRYAALQSVVILDRNGVSLSISPNTKGEYSRYTTTLPARVAELIIQKEDRFFYFHPGVNPLSIIRAYLSTASGEKGGGASTITMQLVKNVLGNETDRSFFNKLQEVFFAIDLELFVPKEKILTMYSNTVYLGNNIQGLAYGSEAYFGRQLEELNDAEIVSLLAALASPSTKNPWTKGNAQAREALAAKLSVDIGGQEVSVVPREDYELPYNLELSSLDLPCTDTCATTLDAELTNKLRNILKEHTDRGWDAGAHTGAIVVLKLPENEIISIVGSPDPGTTKAGAQINMALEPRPIGSTIKPFIYLKGFEIGLRPYSLVDDREYKYPTADGFPLYPKNYDGVYHGIVNLHYALSNSLNVPSVKVLEHVGLSSFYTFLQESLGFKPLRDINSYQYGIALGGLEMDTLTLAHLFSIFPNDGLLKPLRFLYPNSAELGYKPTAGKQTIATPMSANLPEKRVADQKYIELVSRVLNDRNSGVEQFGLASSLNLTQKNYAVKTGTSYDFHDSWTMSYTPDFLVVVWLGNAENKPLRQVSGAEGAGAIWHDAMQLLINSQYNKHTPLSFEKTSNVMIDGSAEFGLPGENPTAHRNLLLTNQSLITSPHDGDIFQFDNDTVIPLTASEKVSWYVDGQLFAQTDRFDFQPISARTYLIEAVAINGKREKIEITLK